MMNKSIALLATLPFLTFGAHADGYLYDSVDSVVRDGVGDCVYTSFWTPEDALRGCDAVVTKTETEQESVVFAAMEPVVPVIQQVTLDADTYFDFDQASLTPVGQDKLDAMIGTLRGYDDLLEMHITGHADRIGDEGYNQQLARKRAMAVKQYLVERGPLDPDLLKMVSMGESDPKVSCEGMRGDALIDCLAPNRRVDIDIKATEVHTSGGS